MPKLNEIVNHNYEGARIAFFPKDGDAMVNATMMCQKFGKRLDSFLKSDGTKKFIQALEERYGKGDLGQKSNTTKRCKWSSNILFSQRGGHPDQMGTWVHQKLAMKLAAWLSVDFELWVYDVLEKLLTEGEVKLEMTAPAPKKLKPTPKKKRIVRHIKPHTLADMLYEICQIRDEKIRLTLAEKAYNETRS